MPDTPRYTEQEIQAILKSAAHRQHQSEPPAPHAGLSLEEVEQIAEEAGIDARHVRAAAEALHDAPADSTHDKIWGGPNRLHFRRVIQGEIPTEDLDVTLIPIIREMTRRKGQYEILGATLTWNFYSGESVTPLHVEVNVADGHTTIEVLKDRLNNQAGMTQIPTMMAGILTVLSAVMPGAQAGLFFPLLLTTLVLYMLGRWGFKKWTAHDHKHLSALTDRLDEAVRTYVAAHAPVQQPEATPASLLTLEEPPPESTRTASRPRGRTR